MIYGKITLLYGLNFTAQSKHKQAFMHSLSWKTEPAESCLHVAETEIAAGFVIDFERARSKAALSPKQPWCILMYICFSIWHTYYLYTLYN